MGTIAADDGDALAQASAALDAGELVVVPGDERYLLVADALDDGAVERLMLALGRGADDAPIVLVSGYEDLHHVAYGGAPARALAERHWPGACVLLLKARPWLPDALTAGGDAARVSAPRAAFTSALVRRFGPLAAATLGESRDADAAREAAGSHARFVADGGALPGGLALVVDAREGEAKVIREGTSARTT